jgi:xanthine/CO dehydrogenase XdhC/CoxF family maturation factor
MSDDLDELEAALRASGWAVPTSTTLLSAADEAIAATIVGKTNARRLVTTARGHRARMVRTREVYAVENSFGWMIGAQEGGKTRVLYEGLTRQDRDRGLALARERGFATAIYDNPGVKPRERERRELAPSAHIEPAPRKRQTITPSAHVKPSKKLALLEQLRGFKAS